jgi:cytochrome c oxidase subunit II
MKVHPDPIQKLKVFVLFASLLFVLTIPALAGPEVKRIEIVCAKSHYSPETIHLRKGEPARLVLKAIDVTHGFALDDFGIAREISPGPPTVIEFTPDKAGTFTFYCVVRCGKSHLKMRGTLIVDE